MLTDPSDWLPILRVRRSWPTLKDRQSFWPKIDIKTLGSPIWRHKDETRWCWDADISYNLAPWRSWRSLKAWMRGDSRQSSDLRWFILIFSLLLAFLSLVCDTMVVRFCSWVLPYYLCTIMHQYACMVVGLSPQVLPYHLRTHTHRGVYVDAFVWSLSFRIAPWVAHARLAPCVNAFFYLLYNRQGCTEWNKPLGRGSLPHTHDTPVLRGWERAYIQDFPATPHSPPWTCLPI